MRLEVLIKGGSYKKESVQKYIFLHCNHLIKEPQTKTKQMLLLAINGMNDVHRLPSFRKNSPSGILILSVSVMILE